MKNTMKNTLSVLGIIALAAVIGFMAGCDNPASSGGFVAVSSITGVPAVGAVGPLTLTGTVNPSDATNKTIVWSVANAGTTGATVSGNTLTTTATGTVTVTATIANGLAQGTPYTEDFTITITPAGGNPFIITYTAVQDGGVDGTADTTGIVFTFSGSIDSLDLAAADITVSGAAFRGAATFTKSGSSWLLAPVGVNAAGTATVRITKSGIEAGAQTVIIHKAGQPTPEYWSITWDLNGGEKGGGTYPDQIVKGAALARPSPNPAKTGDTFRGWYTDPGLTQAYNFAYGVTEDLTLYAKWETFQPPAEVTVTAGSALAEKLQWVQDNAQSNTSYTIEVSADEAIDPQTLSYDGKNDITITLRGSGSAREISLSGSGALFTVESGVTLILGNNITLQGRSDNTAPLVRVGEDGALIMNAGAKITGNTSSYYLGNGGGVYVYGGTFTMNGGEITGNTAAPNESGRGGGVYVSQGTFTMNDGEISGNTAGSDSHNDYGGGVWVGSGTFTMSGGKISNNTSNYYGGGVYVYNSTFMMSSGEISGNTAYYGGGVYNYGIFTMNSGEISGNTGGGVDNNGIFTMSSGEISGNTANYGGGGVNNRGTFTMEGGKVSGNTATSGNFVGSGGGVNNSGTFTMNGGEISNNTGDFSGGGVSGGTFTMNSGKITGNTAFSGGGVSGGTFTMNGGEISNNTASGSPRDGYPTSGSGGGVSGGDFTMNSGKITGNTAFSGGGVHVGYQGTFTMNGGEISNNTASGSPSDYYGGYTGGGGGVYTDGTFTVSGGKISGNTAASDGGGVYGLNGTFTMNSGEISGNTAASDGGGVYVSNYGTFRIVTGTVYGSNETSASKNTANEGAALYVNSSGSYSATAERGTFSGETWNSKGTLGTTPYTIRVINGGSEDEITLGSWTWSAWGDESNGGTSTAAISESNGVITFSGNVTLAYQYGYAGCSAIADAAELAKLKTAQSISFKVKGDGKTYRFELPQSDITDYSYYRIKFVAPVTETTITVNLQSGGTNGLSNPGWGQSSQGKAFNKSNVTNIQWVTNDQNYVTGPFSLTIRDVTLNQ